MSDPDADTPGAAPRPRLAGSSQTDRTARFWRTLNRIADMPEAQTAIAGTPAERVLQHGRLSLWRYRRPRTALAGGPPLVILHGFIGRASVTDLAPDRSLVADLLGHGADVYTIHWGNPTRADRFLRIEDFLEDHIAACLGHVAREAGRPPAVLGICEGGVFASCLAALEPDMLSGLALAVTPIDCHADPDAVVTRWVRSFSTADLARLVDGLGGLPGATLSAAFQAMTPGRTMDKYTAGLTRLADDPEAVRGFLRMETWLADRPDHPGEAAKQVLIEIYHENRLAQGRLMLGDRRVDLSRLRLPVLTAWGEHDHLVPPACARAILHLAPEAVHTPCPVPAGHIGIFVSRRARGILATRLSAWLAGLGREDANTGGAHTEPAAVAAVDRGGAARRTQTNRSLRTPR